MHDDNWMASQGENVFEMYVAHGGPGFWVRRITWGDTCARVVRVGKLTKSGPYFGNPSVLVDVYSLDGQLKDQAAHLPVPGTYKTWRKIEPPDWAGRRICVLWTTRNWTPLWRGSIESVTNLMRRRSPPTEPERIRLNVTYQQKDAAKKLGRGGTLRKRSGGFLREAPWRLTGQKT